MKLGSKILMFVHMLGLSCLGGTVFLQILIFTDILQQGYFMAVENNLVVLFFETVLTAFAFVYFLYMYRRFISSIRQLQ